MLRASWTKCSSFPITARWLAVAHEQEEIFSVVDSLCVRSRIVLSRVTSWCVHKRQIGSATLFVRSSGPLYEDRMVEWRAVSARRKYIAFLSWAKVSTSPSNRTASVHLPKKTSWPILILVQCDVPSVGESHDHLDLEMNILNNFWIWKMTSILSIKNYSSSKPFRSWRFTELFIEFVQFLCHPLPSEL